MLIYEHKKLCLGRRSIGGASLPACSNLRMYSFVHRLRKPSSSNRPEGSSDDEDEGYMPPSNQSYQYMPSSNQSYQQRPTSNSQPSVVVRQGDDIKEVKNERERNNNHNQTKLSAQQQPSRGTLKPKSMKVATPGFEDVPYHAI